MSEPPPPGTNVIIVGRGNMMQAATGTGEGGSGICAPRPDSGKDFELAALMSRDDWMRLKARFGGDD